VQSDARPGPRDSPAAKSRLEAVGQDADKAAHPQLPGRQRALIHFERTDSPGLRRQRGQPSVKQPFVVQVRLL